MVKIRDQNSIFLNFKYYLHFLNQIFFKITLDILETSFNYIYTFLMELWFGVLSPSC